MGAKSKTVRTKVFARNLDKMNIQAHKVNGGGGRVIDLLRFNNIFSLFLIEACTNTTLIPWLPFDSWIFSVTNGWFLSYGKTARKTWIGIVVDFDRSFFSSVCIEWKKYVLVSPGICDQSNLCHYSFGWFLLLLLIFDAAYKIHRRFFILNFERRAAYNKNVFQRTLWMLHTKCAMYTIYIYHHQHMG